MKETSLPFLYEQANNTDLSDFVRNLFEVEEQLKAYPTEQNKQRWQILQEIKKAMIFDITSILESHKEKDEK